MHGGNLKLISRSVLLIIINVSDKICRETQNTYFIFSNVFFENRAGYEIIWKKRSRIAEATDDKVEHGHFMLTI
jgi:hypothetical protein